MSINLSTTDMKIIGATAGTILGAVLGGLAFSTFATSISYWLEIKDLDDGYKYLIVTVIVLLSMPIPGLIGYVGGGDTDTIMPNVTYFLILYATLILVFKELIIPSVGDSLILSVILGLCIYLSTTFGLNTDGTLSGFWIPIIIIFSSILAVYYNFSSIVKAVKNIEELWDDYTSTKDKAEKAEATKAEAEAKAEADVSGSVIKYEAPKIWAEQQEASKQAAIKIASKKRWLSIDFIEYKNLAEKLIETINPVSHPELKPTVEKHEHAINSYIQKSRYIMLAYIAVILIVIAGISMILGFLIAIMDLQIVGTPTLSTKLSSGLQITDIMLICFCIILFIFKKSMDAYLLQNPQLDVKNIEPLVDKVSETHTNLSILTSIIPANFINEIFDRSNSTGDIDVVSKTGQTGGGKISSYKTRKSNTDEKYLKVSF
jgi:hypothetical protein